MKEIELKVQAGEDGVVKVVKVAEDATVETLLKAIEVEGIVVAELEDEILFLLDEEAKLLRKEHKLHEHGFRHGHHIHVGKGKHIFVAVVTTSGAWPHHGYESVPAHQPVKDQLARAAKKLKLASTAGWLAKVDSRVLDINKNYPENGLRHKAVIDYGPPASGGGNE